MREAERRATRSRVIINFTFEGPELVVSAADARAFGGREQAAARAVRHTLKTLIGTKHPKLKPSEQENAIVWMEMVDDDEKPNATAEVPGDVFDWMLELVKDDGVSIDFVLIHWRRAIRRYMEKLLQESERQQEETVAAATASA